jgi:hypothetical protein
LLRIAHVPRTRLSLILLFALVLASCGGDDSSESASTTAAKDPVSLTNADLQENAAFWQAQSDEGRLVLTRMCKAEVARQASAEASAAAEDPTSDSDDSFEAKQAVDAISADDLLPKIDRSVKANPNSSIREACQNVLSGALEPTTITIRGAKPVPELGEDAYNAAATRVLRISGRIEPAGDDAGFTLERRLADDWEYIDSYRTDADGEFKLTLKAYRANSNLYRLRATGSGNASPTKAEIYFDRPSNANASSGSSSTSSGSGSNEESEKALTFSGNGSKSLGTITVPYDAVLKWTNEGELFQVNDEDFEIFVSSEAKSGDSAVDKGTYKDVDVNGDGDWTIRIEPK